MSTVDRLDTPEPSFDVLVRPKREPRHLKVRTGTFPPALGMLLGLLAGAIAAVVIYGAAVAILDHAHPRPGGPQQLQDQPQRPAPAQAPQHVTEA